MGTGGSRVWTRILSRRRELDMVCGAALSRQSLLEAARAWLAFHLRVRLARTAIPGALPLHRCHMHHRCQHTAQEYLATCLLLRLRWLWSQVFDEQKRPTHLVSAINSVCQGGNKDATGKDCKTLSIDLDDTNKFGWSRRTLIEVFNHQGPTPPFSPSGCRR